MPAGYRTVSRIWRARRGPPVVRLSAATAAGIGAADGDVVTVSTGRGAISLPLVVTEMADGVVWLPLNSPGSAVHEQLGVTTGAVVRIERQAGADELSGFECVRP